VNLGGMEATGASIGYYTTLHPKTSFCPDGKKKKKKPDPAYPMTKQQYKNALLG